MNYCNITQYFICEKILNIFILNKYISQNVLWILVDVVVKAARETGKMLFRFFTTWFFSVLLYVVFFFFCSFIFRLVFAKRVKNWYAKLLCIELCDTYFKQNISIFIWLKFCHFNQCKCCISCSHLEQKIQQQIFRFNVNDIMENKICDKTISCIFILHSHTLSLPPSHSPYMNIVILQMHLNWKTVI